MTLAIGHVLFLVCRYNDDVVLGMFVLSQALDSISFIVTRFAGKIVTVMFFHDMLGELICAFGQVGTLLAWDSDVSMLYVCVKFQSALIFRSKGAVITGENSSTVLGLFVLSQDASPV